MPGGAGHARDDDRADGQVQGYQPDGRGRRGRGALSNDEIGAALYISPLTAKTHVNRTMTKLGARDRAQLVITAYETGLVRPGLL